MLANSSETCKLLLIRCDGKTYSKFKALLESLVPAFFLKLPYLQTQHAIFNYIIDLQPSHDYNLIEIKSPTLISFQPESPTMKTTTTQLLFGAAFALTMILPITVSADIMVEEELSGVVDTAGASANLGSFNVGNGDLLVVGVTFEAVNESLDLETALILDGDFGNVIEAEVSSNHSGFQQTAIFVIEDVSGTVDLQLFTNNNQSINDPGFYAVSLSGADGVEVTGSELSDGRFDHTFALAGDGEISEGSFVLAAFSDELGGDSALAQAGVDVESSSADFLNEVQQFQTFSGTAGDVGDSFIGSAVGAIATGFVPSEDDLGGAGLFVEFSEVAPFFPNLPSNQRANFSFVSIAPAVAAVPEPGSVIVLALAGLAATTRRRR